MEVLKKGTIEPLMVAMRDRLGNVSDLSTLSGLLFDVKRKDDNGAVQTNAPWTVDSDYPMTALCLIDTTLAAYVAGEEYKLYLKYVDGSTAAVKGPIFFRVEDD